MDFSYIVLRIKSHYQMVIQCTTQIKVHFDSLHKKHSQQCDICYIIRLIGVDDFRELARYNCLKIDIYESIFLMMTFIGALLVYFIKCMIHCKLGICFTTQLCRQSYWGYQLGSKLFYYCIYYRILCPQLMQTPNRRMYIHEI